MKINQGEPVIRLLTITACAMYALPALADQYVDGYQRSDGTYVQGHYRTDPNDTRLDNYSTRGNTNPYTGEPGYRDPYSASPSAPSPSYGTGMNDGIYGDPGGTTDRW